MVTLMVTCFSPSVKSPIVHPSPIHGCSLSNLHLPLFPSHSGWWLSFASIRPGYHLHFRCHSNYLCDSHASLFCANKKGGNYMLCSSSCPYMHFHVGWTWTGSCRWAARLLMWDLAMNFLKNAENLPGISKPRELQWWLVEESWLTPFWELIITKPVVTVPFSFLIHTTLVLTTWRRLWMADGAGGRSLLIAKAEVSSWKTSSTTFFYPRGPTWCEGLRGNQAWWSWRQERVQFYPKLVDWLAWTCKDTCWVQFVQLDFAINFSDILQPFLACWRPEIPL